MYVSLFRVLLVTIAPVTCRLPAQTVEIGSKAGIASPTQALDLLQKEHREDGSTFVVQGDLDPLIRPSLDWNTASGC